MDSINLKEIGERIQKYRKLAGYSCEKFAELVDISAGFCSDIENGNTGLSLETLNRMSNLLGISCDILIKGYEPNNDLSVIIGLLQRYEPIDLAYLEKIIHLILAISKGK
jgi:transcriptional regulator with XRE-family HTH domain